MHVCIKTFSAAGVFMRILRNSSENLFHSVPLGKYCYGLQYFLHKNAPQFLFDFDSCGNWRAKLNPFVPKAPFLYPLKTSKNLRFSDVFRGQRKGALGTNGLKEEGACFKLRHYSHEILKISRFFFQINYHYDIQSHIFQNYQLFSIFYRLNICAICK